MVDIWRSSEITPEQIRARGGEGNAAAEDAAREIIQAVREGGDSALFAYTERFDGAKLSRLAVTEQELDTALAETDPTLIAALECAARNIRAYHQRQVRQGFAVAEQPGVILGQRVLPLDRVGLYIPGGTAAYPSSVLMNAIPAKIAGVPEILLATPPNKEGKAPPQILAAARVAGVDRIYKMGGAQAVAAFAYGTESVPRVDKITGPGNAYVAAAKRQVYGVVDIDMIAGPSEILVIADSGAQARWVAADLLSQAEHDAMAAAILLTTDEALAKAVQVELGEQLAQLPRREIATKSLAQNGRIVLVSTLREAAEISNAIAPEHLELCVEDPFALLGEIRHAGSIFLGQYAPEALGDYCAGPNHTLPTNGAARFASPLSVDDFVKKSSFIYYDKKALRKAAEDIECIARAEGFEAHARSVAARFNS